MGYIYNPNGASQWDSRQNMQNIKRLDLTRAVFPVQNDMRIADMTGVVGQLDTLYLPISAAMNTIPDSCLCVGNNTTVEELCIPGNFQHFGDWAFYSNGGNLKHIYTTAIDAEGNGYPARKSDADKYDESKIIDMWDDNEHSMTPDAEKGGCFTFSENLKSVGTKCFNQYNLKDVYNMATTAPTCKFNAFSSVSYMNNNGYLESGIAKSVTRNIYGGGNGKWMTYLHFPETCSDEEKAHYTDVTRKYSIPDGDGRTDGNGDIVCWPTQPEWGRSEAQAIAGITWEFWKDADDGADYVGSYENTAFAGVVAPYDDWMRSSDNVWTGDSLLYTYYGYSLLDKTYSTSNNAKGFRVKGTASLKNSGASYIGWVDDTDAVYDTDYMGWHQFVLAYTSVTKKATYDAYKTDNWYTFCVPTDLTKAELLEYFGVPAGATIDGEAASGTTYPKLVTLYGVDRNMDSEQITLRFTKDLVGNNKRWNFEADSYYGKDQESNHYEDLSNDDDVIVYAGCPYLIKPYKPVAIDTLSNYTYNPAKYMLGIKTGVKSSTNGDMYKHYPKIDYVVTAARTENKKVDDEYVEDHYGDSLYVYHFIGTYKTDTIAANDTVYYWGKNKKGVCKWYRHTNGKQMNWNPYICMAGALGTTSLDSTFVTMKGTGDKGVNVYSVKYHGAINDDLFNLVTGAKTAPSYVMAFDDDEIKSETTGIEEIADVEETEEVVSGPVYSVNGQRVNSNSLAKGVYIRGGKKFVVK